MNVYIVEKLSLFKSLFQNLLIMKKHFLAFYRFLIGFTANAQGLMNKSETVFTHQDTLRGSITKERAWWDLKYYHLM